SEDGYSDDERPVHRVTLGGFWIGQCEVTNAQYRAFCDATGQTFPRYPEYYPYQGGGH
ncbi:MAG TPA: gliding motility-associated lipoprotein GldK, partial [Armatimonadetes bacterium]|nr:gliding motility-associated lipoprotein GldK [Armatimonadota bacterium]